MTDYYIILAKGVPNALLRRDNLFDIQRWQPESDTWIYAPWEFDYLNGPDSFRSRKITDSDAAEIQADNPFDMVDLSDESIKRLLDAWFTPPPPQPDED